MYIKAVYLSGEIMKNCNFSLKNNLASIERKIARKECLAKIYCYISTTIEKNSLTCTM